MEIGQHRENEGKSIANRVNIKLMWVVLLEIVQYRGNEGFSIGNGLRLQNKGYVIAR